MVISEQACVMLLRRDFFESFHRRGTARPGDPLEVMTAVSAASREDVDDLCDRALATGATPASAPDDQGFMYGRSFVDLDGHVWEVMWMDPAARRAPPRPVPVAEQLLELGDQRDRGALDDPEHLVEAVRAAVVGVRHVAAPDRVEVPEQEHGALDPGVVRRPGCRRPSPAAGRARTRRRRTAGRGARSGRSPRRAGSRRRGCPSADRRASRRCPSWSPRPRTPARPGRRAR